MDTEKAAGSVSQLQMPGVHGQASGHARSSCCGLTAGRPVVYLGHGVGHLRYGSRGVVRQALRNRAVVDMGTDGTWHLPYFYLADPLRAA